MPVQKKLSVVIAACSLFLAVCFSGLMLHFRQELESQVPEYNRHLKALEADADRLDRIYYASTPEPDATNYEQYKADAKRHADTADTLSLSIHTNPFYGNNYKDGRENSGHDMLLRERLQGVFLRFIEPK